MARYAHPSDFFRIADELPQRELCTLLGVDKKILARWRAGRTRIPWACYELTYEHSRYGLAERDAAEHFNRVMLEQANTALREQIGQLERLLADQARLIDWGAANDPFVWPTDPRSRA